MSTLTGRDTSFGEMFKRAKRRAYLLRADVSWHQLFDYGAKRQTSGFSGATSWDAWHADWERTWLTINLALSISPLESATTLDLCASTRDWIARSPSRHEIQDFADWLKAQHYTDFVCDRHLRRLLLLLPRLSPDGRLRSYSPAASPTIYWRARWAAWCVSTCAAASAA